NKSVHLHAMAVLQGRGKDPQELPLNYRWSLMTKPPGSNLSLKSNEGKSDESQHIVKLTADMPGTYDVQLINDNGYLSSVPSTATVTTDNTAPVADAGPNQSVPVGATVFLDGSGSSDADHDTFIYNWSFVSRPPGSNATLANPSTVSPTFVADVSGT